MLFLPFKAAKQVGNDSQSRISYFLDEVINGINLPQRFTFPFFYEPHPLAKIAAAQLQDYLEAQTNFDHNFGFDSHQGAIGKMFGVLIVQDQEGKLGYLSAFSGKLAGTNDHPKFVPPVFDMLVEDSFFLKEQEVISAINNQIDEAHADKDYNQVKQQLEQLSAQSEQEISDFKNQLKSNKQNRKKLRQEQKAALSPQAYQLFEADLIKQSLHDKHQLRVLTSRWDTLLEEYQARIAHFETKVEALKTERRERSAALQKQLFEQYVFLNRDGKHKSLQDIFGVTVFGNPPAGAGECATPKLLQFAFANGYKPIAMAEFWWGASPKSEIRKHKQFYPACTGKCKPILAHMLEGIPVDDNPFLQNSKAGSSLEIVYQDEYLVVVNKQAGLRSVPGIDIQDSVYTRLQQALTDSDPLIIHRLDMGTSGLLIVAKTQEAHKHLQKQFLKRTVRKRYTALLSKVVDETAGEIDLPLRGDPFNRPRQLVCFEYGKKSITRWKVVARTETSTRIHFWPLTGRTHQLRMHSAHELGLNAPIVGDDLYGTSAERLYLHAAELEFQHPITQQTMHFHVPEDF